VLFSEPKIPQWRRIGRGAGGPDISVLFSEPKIPQFVNADYAAMEQRIDFSALQRAENSSIEDAQRWLECVMNFSALQRAENSSIIAVRRAHCKR